MITEPTTATVELTKLELNILVENHKHHARDLRGTALMFEDEDDPDRDLEFAARMRQFAILRDTRAMHLERIAAGLDDHPSILV